MQSARPGGGLDDPEWKSVCTIICTKYNLMKIRIYNHMYKNSNIMYKKACSYVHFLQNRMYNEIYNQGVPLIRPFLEIIQRIIFWKPPNSGYFRNLGVPGAHWLKEALSFHSSKTKVLDDIGPDIASNYLTVLCNISKPTLQILYFSSVLEPLVRSRAFISGVAEKNLLSRSDVIVWSFAELAQEIAYIGYSLKLISRRIRQ